MPADFTATSPGANPDHDSYGGTPWAYVQGTSTASPGTATLLPTFATTINGTLAGWESNDGNAFVAKSASPAPLEMQPDATGFTAIRWTSPFSHPMTVSVTDSVTAAGTGGLGCLANSVGSQLENQSGAGISTGSNTVPAHGSIDLIVQYTGTALAYSPTCNTEAVTFGVQATAVAPSPTITSPISGAVLKSSQPTISGSGGSDFGDSGSVTVNIYPGPSATGTPVQTLTANVGAAGAYSVSPTTALADGQYTVQTEQSDTLGDIGTSPAVKFSVKTHPPSVSLAQPSAGTATTSTKPSFSGTAGTVFGDARTVTVQLFKGSATGGKPFATMKVKSPGANWSARWKQALKTGTYTARVTQTDDAGHTGTSDAHTFRIVSGSIGPSVTLSHGAASIQITCTAAPGKSCTGTILIVTVRHLQPVFDGPVGPVRVLFAYVDVPGGTTQTVKRSVAGFVAQALRRHGPLTVRVTAKLSNAAASTTRRLG